MPTTRSRLGLPVALIVAASALVFCLLSLRPPSDSELRYVESCREMVSSHDFVVPTLSGVAYMEKPILTYWLGALSQAIGGRSNLVVRLPSILASTATVALTAACAAELGSGTMAATAAALAALSGYLLVMGSVFTTDPLFATLVLAGWYAFLRHCAGSRTARWWFWIATGLAALAKGPLGMVFTCGGAGAFLIAARRRDLLVRLAIVRGISIIALINAPWIIAVARRDPRLVWFFYYHENVEAFFNGHVNHPGPVFYYLLILPAAVMPFPAAILGCAGLGTRRALAWLRQRWGTAPWDRPWDREDGAWAPAAVAVCAIFSLVFLSMSASKLPTYILPVLPLIAVLASDEFARINLRSPPRWLSWAVFCQAVLVLLGGIGAFTWSWFHPPAELLMIDRGDAIPVTMFGILITAALLMPLGVFRWGLGWSVFGSGCAFALALLAVTPTVSRITPLRDGTILARYVAVHGSPSDVVVVDSSCEPDYDIELALDRPVLFAGRTRELGMGFFVRAMAAGVPLPEDPYTVEAATVPPCPGLVSAMELEDLWKSARRVWLFTDGHDAVWLDRSATTVIVGEAPGEFLVTNHSVPWPLPPRNPARPAPWVRSGVTRP